MSINEELMALIDRMASQFQDVYNRIALLTGSVLPPGSALWLQYYAGNVDPMIVDVITRDFNDTATAANVVWPDGTLGQFTAITLSSAFPGAVDAYTVTYNAATQKTATQGAVTRNANGAVINRPAITIV